MNKRVRLMVVSCLILGLIIGYGWDALAAKRPFEGVKIVASMHTSPTTEAIKKLVSAFEAKYGAKVTVIEEHYEAMHERQMAEFIAHTGAYDIIEYPYQWLAEYAGGGHLVDLYTLIKDPQVYDPAFDMDDWIAPVVKIYGEWEGGLYAIPNKFDIYIAVYRKDLYQRYGLKPPATWEELKQSSEKLSLDLNGDGKTDIYGLALPLAVDDPLMCTFHPFLWSFGGDYFDENKYPIFHREPGLRAVETIKSLLPYMPEGVLGWAYEEVQTAMEQGMIAYMIQWHAFVPDLEDPAKSKVVGKVDWDLTPAGPVSRLQSLGGWGIGIAADSRNKAAAWKFIEFVHSKENSIKFARAGGSSARMSALTDPEVVKAQPWTPVLLEALKNCYNRPRILNWFEVEHIVAVALSDILFGKIGAKEGLTKAAAEVYEAMQRVGYTPEKSGLKPTL